MRTLGAYYQTVANMPIDGLGLSPDGLGAEPPMKLGFGEETLVALLSGQLGPSLVQPIGIFTPWGEQTGDVTWKSQAPDWNLVTYPITDAALQAARSAAFGHDVGWVAILTPKPATLAQANAAFKGRPYKLFSAEGVYRQDDNQAVPRIWFLYWGQLRDDPQDPEAGQGSMETAAKQLGGQLTFVVQTPRTGKERAHPSVPFLTALNTQLTAGGAPAPTTLPAALPPGVPAPTKTAPIVSATGPAAVKKPIPTWVWWAGAVALVAGGGYYAWRKRKG